MNLKRIATAGVALFALSALAQNGFVEGTHGKGVAVNREGNGAEFAFEVVRVKNEKGETNVRGRLQFATLRERSMRVIQVSMRAERLAISKNVAEFGGPGELVVREGREPKRFLGRVMVRVQDMAGGEKDSADRFALKFEGMGKDRNFGFEGLVKRGDIVVKPK